MPDLASIGFPRDSRMRVIMWREIFVVVDRGNTRVSDYIALARDANLLARQYPDGIGCLTILPPTASPPPHEVRVAIKEAYEHVSKHLRCVCWCVEGAAFRAAAVRAALAGIRLLMRPAYPTLVTDSLEEAVPWMYSKLHPGGVPADPDAAIATIRADLTRRSSWPPPYAASLPEDEPY